MRRAVTATRRQTRPQVPTQRPTSAGLTLSGLTLAGLTLAGLTLAGLVLAGCSGATTTAGPTSGTTSPAPPTTGPTTGPTTSAAGTAQPTASGGSAPGAGPSAGTGPQGLCRVISVAELNRMTGFRIGTSTSSAENASCTYTPSEAAKRDDVAVITAEGRLTNSLDVAAVGARNSFGLSRITHTTVNGADGARLVTGKTNGVTSVFVIATRGGAYYTALTGGRRSTATYTAAMQKVVARLITG